MLWPLLTIAALVAAAILHFAWRARFERAQAAARRELEALNQARAAEAHELQVRQEALFDSMAEGLLLLDDTGHIQVANQAFARLFDLTVDVRSRTLLEALRLHELSELVAKLGGQIPNLERELRITAPVERWLLINGAAILDANGQRKGTVLVFHDLSRLKQLENARKEFVANVSHELRTPLSLIKGYVETLLDGAKDTPELTEKFLKIIDRSTERLRVLIEDLLTISELESGRLKLDLRPVELRPLTEKVLGDFKLRAEARRVTLFADFSDDLKIQADAGRVEQVLANLIDNAIKYGRDGERVTVGAQATAEGVAELSVQDDGPGIPPEALERVFERFYRVDKARSREQGGTGLGLSIVKHIVQSHGGRVWARSEVGRGATFYFTMPLAEEESEQPALL